MTVSFLKTGSVKNILFWGGGAERAHYRVVLAYFSIYVGSRKKSPKNVVVEANNWTCFVQMLFLCGFKSLLKRGLDWLCNRIWIGTFWTVCAVCVQFDVSNLQIFLFLSPFILSSPQGPSADVFYPLSIPCAALLTYSTPSCKPITLNRVLDSDRSKQISTHSCHLTRFNQPYWFYEM